MLGGATQAMPLCAAPLRAAAREARWLRCSLLTYRNGYARPSRLPVDLGGLQQSANVIL